MSLTRFKRGLFFCSLALCCVLMSAGAALAQEQSSTTTGQAHREEADLEIRLHLLVASNAAGEGAKLPAQLDAAVRGLRSSLPFTSYRWANTFINRVNNGANSEISGIAGPLLGTTAPTSGTPSFYVVKLNDVRLVTGAANQELVRFRVHFGARLPIVVGGGGGNSSAPTVNYEGTGISTSISIPENENVIVGTMSLGPSNEMLVLMVSARKIS
jgi:hypothetical protein